MSVYRAHHVSDCPVCSPPPPLWQIVVMLAVVLTPGLVLLALGALL